MSSITAWGKAKDCKALTRPDVHTGTVWTVGSGGVQVTNSVSSSFNKKNKIYLYKLANVCILRKEKADKYFSFIHG